MKHARKNLSETSIELTVTLDAADLNTVRPLTIAKLAKDAKVPGFRQGKVPTKVAEKHLGEATIQSQLIEDAVNKFIIDVLDAEAVQPLDRPHVEIESIDPAKEMVFKATVEILPKVTLGDYKNLKVTPETPKVTAKDIQNVIERMQLGFAEKKEVKRAAKTDDEVWIDFEGVDEKGEPVAGATGKDYPLKLGSNTFIPGFEDGLIGHSAGETFDLPLTFPDDYHHAPLKGAKVTFKVTVNKVQDVELPKLDDEFAAKCGPFKNIDELKADVKKELLAQRGQEVTNKLKDQLVEKLVSVSTVPVPEILVKDQVQSIERDMIQNLMYQGKTLDQYLNEQGLTHDEWRDKELHEAATRRVQVGLVLAELSKVEKVQPTREELDARHAELIQQYTDPKIQAQLDTPEARRDLANRVVTEKTVDRLVELNS